MAGIGGQGDRDSPAALTGQLLQIVVPGGDVADGVGAEQVEVGEVLLRHQGGGGFDVEGGEIAEQRPAGAGQQHGVEAEPGLLDERHAGQEVVDPLVDGQVTVSIGQPWLGAAHHWTDLIGRTSRPPRTAQALAKMNRVV